MECLASENAAEFVEGAKNVSGHPSSGATRGRFAVAGRTLKPGEIAMKFPALGCILHGHHQGRRCNWCFCSIGADIQEKPLRCSRCKETFYCNRACQEADWRAGHKLECSAKAKLAKSFEATGIVGSDALKDALLAGRCIRASSSSAKPSGGVVSDLESLEGRLEKEQENLFRHISNVMAACAPELVAGATGTASDAIFNALTRFQNNNFAVVDDLFLPLGAACYPNGATLNHSCAPNCLCSYVLIPGKPPHQIVLVMEEVAKGEELTHSYIELSAPSWERQANLRDTYNFECACNGCKGDACAVKDTKLVADVCGRGSVYRGSVAGCSLAPAPASVQRDADLQRAEALISEAATEEDAAKETRMLGMACSLLAKWLNTCHMDLVETYAQAHKAAMAAADWDIAAAHCKDVVEQYIEIYPPWHPVVGIQMNVLAELLETTGSANEAVRWYRKAMDILSVTHGRNHTMVEYMRSRIQELC